MRCFGALFIFLVAAIPIWAQGQKDTCKVVFLDVADARKQAKTGQDIESLATVIGKFEAAVGEEVLTTRHFAIPSTKQYITASVYYTDETMTPLRRPDSNMWQDSTIQLGILISEQKPESAFFTEDNAVAETNYAKDTLRVSTEKFFKANRRLYWVSLECVCNGAIERP
jgi:hypothetical protein